MRHISYCYNNTVQFIALLCAEYIVEGTIVVVNGGLEGIYREQG